MSGPDSDVVLPSHDDASSPLATSVTANNCSVELTDFILRSMPVSGEEVWKFVASANASGGGGKSAESLSLALPLLFWP